MKNFTVQGVTGYCDCMPNEGKMNTIDHYVTAFPEECTVETCECRFCGQQWSSEVKPIPGGVAIYLYKKPA